MEEFSKIREWAEVRGIYKNGDSKTQLIKAFEEMGEISKFLLKKNHGEVIDGVGDVVVVLTNFIKLYSQENGLDVEVEDCIRISYQEISDRKGKMVNGTFEKE